MMITRESLYEKQIDHWVLDAVARGVTSFDMLLTSLPGVYPSLVIGSIQRLTHNSTLPNSILQNAIKYVKHDNKRLNYSDDLVHYNVPHPLDYDWRFTQSTAMTLLEYSRSVSRPGDMIALFSLPTLLDMVSTQFYQRKMILLDKNSYPTIKGVQPYKCDLLKDQLPNLKAQVIVTDPPWYPDYIRVFIWAATHLCEIGSKILVCLPPIGTRPGINQELEELVDWTKELGLSLVRYEKGVLSYSTPPFERNALRAQGINTIPTNWRKGDLALFSCQQQVCVARPQVVEEGHWYAVSLNGVHIRIRLRDLSGFHDPSLISIVPNDILPSVSRRDPRRMQADVWTSGNRIFACKGTNILIGILNSILSGVSIFEELSDTLGRQLLPSEREKVLAVQERILDILDIEHRELLELGYGK